jgi:glycosyltransferase involved in cell wall biosynthesis
MTALSPETVVSKESGPEIRKKICPPVVCFGDSDWWYHNRGHMDMQLMRRFAQFAKVLYVNSIVVRKFNLQEGTMFFHRFARKIRSIFKGLKPSGIENLMIYSPFTMPVHHIPVVRSINHGILSHQILRQMRRLGFNKPLVWVTCPAAAPVAVNLARTKLVYQRSDCYEQFPGVDSEQVKKYDELLKKHADLVIYVNKEFMAQEMKDCKKAMFLDHGVDYEFFADALQNSYVPQEMRQILHPILGFYGGIDEHTTDISLVEKVADLLKDFSIVLIGSSSIDLSSLASHRNVYLLGQKPYEQIPHYAKCFDVCFMPWQQNKWIQACNPVKLKEYLALGKPIVSTPFKELGGYDGLVTVACDAASFADAVIRALQQNRPELVSQRQRSVSGSTWDVKAQRVLRALRQAE